MTDDTDLATAADTRNLEAELADQRARLDELSAELERSVASSSLKSADPQTILNFFQVLSHAFRGVLDMNAKLVEVRQGPSLSRRDQFVAHALTGLTGRIQPVHMSDEGQLKSLAAMAIKIADVTLALLDKPTAGSGPKP